MKNLKPIMISGKETLPIVEGGKGINATDGKCSGAWAAENCVGTFSGVIPDCYDDNGNVIKEEYISKNRADRQQEMVKRSIQGSVDQAKIAYESSNGTGRIHINLLWEFGGAEKILNGILEKTKGLINGVTCGAGLPYKLGEIATKFETYYYPIISSARAFQVLWKRSYKNFSHFLGGIVYEDPWLAGGHVGLSNSENVNEPQSPYARLIELRKNMNEYGLHNIPIILAGGIWSLDEWKDYIDNPDIGKIAFQFGTRPLLTKESPISDAWKRLMTTIKRNDIVLQNFSPTGFLSSAFKNTFLEKLLNRKDGEVEFSEDKSDDFSFEIIVRNRSFFINPADESKMRNQIAAGFTEIRATPDKTFVFLTEDDWKAQQKDRADCIGCLSQCQFSSWSQANTTTGKTPDPRSYCISKTLRDVGHDGDIQNNLIFAGAQAIKFGTDPLYANGNIPSVKELIQAIMRGE